MITTKKIIMKTNLFTLKRLFFLFALTGSSFFLTAQTMQISNTNAKGYSYVGENTSTWNQTIPPTHTITLPFHATSFTGTFTIKKESGSNPCTTNPNFFNMSVFNMTTSTHMANNATGNTYVTLPSTYSFPIGITFLKLSWWCYDPSQSNNPVSSIVVRVVVIKEPNPNLNIVLTPYCKKNQNNMYNGYIGFTATGTASNINGLEFKVTNQSLPSAIQVHPLSSLIISPPFQIIPYNFHSSNLYGTYTISLQHKYNRIMTNYPSLSYVTTTYPIPTTNSYGWTNRVWKRTLNTCVQDIGTGVVGPKAGLGGKSSDPKGLIEEVDRSKEHKLIVYPNPTSGTINFEPSSEDIIVKQFNVYDTTNSLLLSKQINNVGKQTVDLSDLKEGIYMLQIETNKGIETTKIIKNK